MKKLFCFTLVLITATLCVTSCGKSSDVKNRKGAETIMQTEKNTDEFAQPSSSIDDGTDLPTGGVPVFCPVHGEYYHDVFDPSFLCVDEESEERVNEWFRKNSYIMLSTVENNDNDNGCIYPKYTIKKFIDDFELTKEEVRDALEKERKCCHNIDLLFDGSMEEIDAYYRDVDARGHSLDRQEILFSIRAQYLYRNGIEEKTNLWYDTISMAEFVREYNVNRESFETFLTDFLEEYQYPTFPTKDFTYDLDTIFGENAINPYTEVNGRRLNRYELDSIFCCVDNICVD